MLHIDGRLCGKPVSADDARQQWQAIGGRSGQLYTGHAVLRLLDGEPIQRADETATTTVDFGVLTAEELTAYVDSGEPLHVAGGFTIDGLGGWFVDRIDGDPSNVVGLSLPLLRRLLGRVGLSVAALWQRR
jgi:septum formation protein